MCGAVPVVTRLEGVTDRMVDDGVTGVLVERDDVDGFAAAVSALLGDEGRREEMSRAAAAEGAARFGLEKMLDRYERLFAEGDDRGAPGKAHLPGWIAECAVEAVRRGVDRGWMKRRLAELWGSPGGRG